jgi:hypothetical protein
MNATAPQTLHTPPAALVGGTCCEVKPRTTWQTFAPDHLVKWGGGGARDLLFFAGRLVFLDMARCLRWLRRRR